MPRKIIFRITWIVILIFLLFDFIFNANRTFLPLNYSWSDIKLLETFDNINIDTLSLDYLEIKLSDKRVNSNQTFCLKNKKKHFFRATNIKKEDSIFAFSGIKWLNGPPQLKITTTTFQIVDLPLKEWGSITITTIGDSQMLWRDGREFRKNLSVKNRNICFKGAKKDVYGYPCEAETFINIEKISDNINNTEGTQYYILFLGAHDKKTDKSVISKSVCKIYEILSSRTITKGIFVITLPPSPIFSFEEYNKSLNDILKKCSYEHENIVIIDLYNYLKEKREYLQEDGVHLNEYGHSLLSNLILKRL